MHRPGKRRGRGATRNPSPRFLPTVVETFDDGWGTETDQRIKTVVRPDKARSLITRNDSPDVPFSQSINPYRGCEHGCVYCFARPSHAYLDLSPGFDFESQIFYKEEAASRLRDEFARRNYKPATIVIGASTDAYQPVEREKEITRELLQLFLECKHPVSLLTKSSLILRDREILAELASHGLVSVFVSVTTLKPELARRMEPRAHAPHRRLQVIRGLSELGVPVGVLASPMIPGLNDAELEAILHASREAGASSAGYILLRLPGETKELFTSWLEENYPLRRDRVLGLIRDTRGGKLYNSDFGTRMRGVGPYAELLHQRFCVALKRLGLGQRLPALATDLFERPHPNRKQLALF